MNTCVFLNLSVPLTPLYKEKQRTIVRGTSDTNEGTSKGWDDRKQTQGDTASPVRTRNTRVTHADTQTHTHARSVSFSVGFLEWVGVHFLQ